MPDPRHSLHWILRHRSIMSDDHTGAMGGVWNGKRVGQHHLNDLRPRSAGPDDAGEGEGGGAQTGSGNEVGEGSVGGDEECVLGGEGGEASGRGVVGAEHDRKGPSCTIC